MRQEQLFKLNYKTQSLNQLERINQTSGPNVKGLDFAVEGLGEFENITHSEAKNAVGSAIEIADGFDANIWKQGKKIGKKSVWQKKFWSNTSRTSQIPNLNVSAYLPQSVNSTLTVVDCYDVPDFEKQT